MKNATRGKNRRERIPQRPFFGTKSICSRFLGPGRFPKSAQKSLLLQSWSALLGAFSGFFVLVGASLSFFVAFWGFGGLLETFWRLFLSFLGLFWSFPELVKAFLGLPRAFIGTLLRYTELLDKVLLSIGEQG